MVREQVLGGSLLTQRSRENRERIWTLIQQRYLIPTTPWLTSQLAEMGESGSHGREFVSLLYLLYALRDRLTFDFVTSVLSVKGHQSRPVVSRNDVLDLLNQAALVVSLRLSGGPRAPELSLPAASSRPSAILAYWRAIRKKSWFAPYFRSRRQKHSFACLLLKVVVGRQGTTGFCVALIPAHRAGSCIITRSNWRAARAPSTF